MSKNLVCILTAGVGSRMGKLSDELNKALFVFKDKAIISHIIDNFSSNNTKFVIGLGYKGEQIKNFLKIAHPNCKFKFVKIHPYKGIGSGPGLSLLKCKKYLNKPFYFIPCDAYLNQKIPANKNNNWIGLGSDRIKDNKNYCNIQVSKNKIEKIFDKISCSKKNIYQFTGLCFIKDTNVFWDGLKDKKLINNEIQISNGFNNLIKSSKLIYPKFIKWYDLGDYEKYKNTNKKYQKYDFSKSNEAIYIYKDKIIKFFTDQKIVKQKLLKIKNKNNLFPKIINKKSQFYAYKFFEGKTLYQKNDKKIFKDFLNLMHNKLWKNDTKLTPKLFKINCQKFYLEKTQNRYKKFRVKYNNYNELKKVNNKNYQSIKNILREINWEYINDGKQSYIHGDLQFDNILYNEKKKKFLLIDWRQTFGNSIYSGDLYYDLAKIYGGILIDYSQIKKNKFSFKEDSKNIKFRIPKIKHNNEYKKIIKDYVGKRKLDMKKVKILTGIIFLNMAPLHTYPFDKILFNYSRKILHEEIRN